MGFGVGGQAAGWGRAPGVTAAASTHQRPESRSAASGNVDDKGTTVTGVD